MRHYLQRLYSPTVQATEYQSESTAVRFYNFYNFWVDLCFAGHAGNG